MKEGEMEDVKPVNEETSTPRIIEVQKERLAPPGEKKETEKVSVDATPSQVYNKDTVLYMLYLQYKANMITRQHLKGYFKIISDKHPTDIAKWLVEEAARG